MEPGSEKARMKRKAASSRDAHDADVQETPKKRRLLTKSASLAAATMDVESLPRHSPLRPYRTETAIQVKPSPSRSYGSPRDKQKSPSRSPCRPITPLASPAKHPANSLSSIFAMITPKSERKPKTNGTKSNTDGRTTRMLSRTGSMGSAAANAGPSRDVSPTPLVRQPTISLESLPETETPQADDSKEEPTKHEEILNGGLSVAYEPSNDTRTGFERKGRTYAGRSRSFLVSVPLSSLQASADTLANSPFGARIANRDEDELEVESYADREQRWGESSFGVSTDIQSNQDSEAVIPLSSISELRLKGESRRFLDELGYLFDGLSPARSLTVRRSSVLEIVRKLCDNDFMRKAKAADFFICAWDKLKDAGVGVEGDPVMNLSFCLLAGLIADDPQEMSKLAAREDFVSTLTELLDNQADADIAGLITRGGECLSNAKINRVEKALVSPLCSLPVPPSGKTLTASSAIAIASIFLPSHQLSQISDVLREKIDMIKAEGEDLSGSLLMSYTLRNLPPSSST